MPKKYGEDRPSERVTYRPADGTPGEVVNQVVEEFGRKLHVGRYKPPKDYQTGRSTEAMVRTLPPGGKGRGKA